MDEITTTKSKAFYFKRILGSILLLTIAAVFFYSAYAKLDSLEVFEWTFMDIGLRNYSAAVVLSRLFIALELAIGALLVFHIYLKKLTYPLTIGVLAFFTAYLIILIAARGNSGNCQCFGEQLEMTPLEAIIKNVVMIGIVILLSYIYPIKPYKGQIYVASILLMASIVTAMITYPINIGNRPAIVNEAAQLDLLYKGVAKPDVELRQGKHIVCFMSLTCPHCRKAAGFFRILHKQHPEFPIYFILVGNEDHLDDFYKETEAKNVPHVHLKERGVLSEMGIDSVPTIYWLNNGVIEYKGNYLQLDPSYIEEWLKK